MTEDKKPRYYICGSNLHGQIDQMLDMDQTAITSLFYTLPQYLPMVRDGARFYFKWSQILLLQDERNLTCYGFNREKVQKSIETWSGNPRQVVPSSQNILVESQDGIHSVAESGSAVDVLCRGDFENMSLLDGTENRLLAVDDKGHIHEANLQDLREKQRLQFSPFDTSFRFTVQSVACGLEHVLVLTEDGGVHAYGSNSRGQLGQEELSVDEVTAPTIIPTLEGIHISSLSAGGWHSLAVTADGDVYIWGWNEKGQLGLPSPNVRQSVRKRPIAFTDGSNSPREISSSGHEESVIDDKNTVKDLPLDLYQNIDPVLIQTVPFGLDIPDDVKVTKTACGTRHSCVLLDSGLLMTCGWNGYGQLGHGDSEDCDSFKTLLYFVGRQVKVTDVYAGAWNTVIKTEPTVTYGTDL